jgi:hypothetical protein
MSSQAATNVHRARRNRHFAWFSGGLAALLAIAIAMVLTTPARSLSGTTGSAEVTVTPTEGLTDGQAVTVTVKVNDGALYEIAAHLCSPTMPIKNRFNFSFQGEYCSPSSVSPSADTEVVKTVPPGQAQDQLTFHVGIGTGQPWVDDLNNNTHQLTCGPGSPCWLLVKLQVTGDTLFYAAPVAFDPLPPAPPPSGDSGQGVPAAAVAGSAAASSDASGATQSKGGSSRGASGSSAGSSGDDATSRSAGSSAADRASGSSNEALGQKSSSKAASDGNASAADDAHSATVDPVVVSSVGAAGTERAVRVYGAGFAGLIGGVLVVMILVHGRRRMIGTV